MSLRTTVHLVQFVLWPASGLVLFLLAKRCGVVFLVLMLLVTVGVAAWETCLRCPKCKAWLFWQRRFFLYFRRFCQSCGYDLGRKERRR